MKNALSNDIVQIGCRFSVNLSYNSVSLATSLDKLFNLAIAKVQSSNGKSSFANGREIDRRYSG
jgi:hypothetical protein